jgi:type IX secretion system PorP/SprF family membrane protein
MKRYLLIVLVGLSHLGIAQQDPQYSQYLFNTVVINPAYAGSREYINLNGLYRKQWVQVTGSPSSQLISVDVPLYNNHVGVGLFAFNDELGAQFKKGVYGTFAYRIKVSAKGRLALGVSGVLNQAGIDGDKLNTDQPNDPAVPTSRVSKVKGDGQVGIYFNTHKYFAGVSLTNMVNNNFSDFLFTPERRHLYVTTGFVSTISNNFKIRPSILIKDDFKGPTNGDITAFLIFKDKIWLGSSYRTRLLKNENNANTISQDAVVLMVEIFPIENLRIGYGYDITLTDFKNYPTHEFSLGYNINPARGNKMLSPRYF